MPSSPPRCRRRVASPLVHLGALVLLAACGSPAGTGTPVAPPTPDGPDTPGVPTTIVRTRENVPYATTHIAQRLDLYLPDSGAGPFPLVIWVHGGGWQGGTRLLGANAFQRSLTRRGYAVATVEYRLSSDATWPAQIEDVKAAVRSLRANATEYRLDAQRFAGWGSSAGGHLVAMLGVTDASSGFDNAALGNSGVSSRVHAVVDWYGPSDLLRMDRDAATQGCGPGAQQHGATGSAESLLLGVRPSLDTVRARNASPVFYASAGDAPMLIVHGQQDCTVSWKQSERLAEALRTSNGAANVELILYPTDGHGGGTFGSASSVDAVVAFLTRVLH
jgi:acetyl esterase/lipase